MNITLTDLDRETLIENIIDSTDSYSEDGIFLNAYIKHLIDLPVCDYHAEILDELSDEVKKVLKKYLMKEEEKEEDEEDEFYSVNDKFKHADGGIFKLTSLGSHATDKVDDELALVMIAIYKNTYNTIGYIWQTGGSRHVKDNLKITKKEFSNIANGDSKYFHKIED